MQSQTSLPRPCFELEPRFLGRTFALVGASGKLGCALVPALSAEGAKLVLFGRDVARLERQFPGFECRNSVEFAKVAATSSFSAVIDLATINNHCAASLEQHREANVARPLALAEAAKMAGVPLFLSLSSTHAIDPANSHPYAVSKREFREQLLDLDYRGARVLVLPKIAFAEPGSIRARAWILLGVLKPVTLFCNFFTVIADSLNSGPSAQREVYLAPVGENFYAVLSRALDLILALTILVGAGWLMFLIALVVRLDSEGPAIFAQRRIGQYEIPFTLLKFRTMAVGTREAGTHEIANSSVTKVGALLRKSKLDELPQVINILRGELAFVGPRPCLPLQTELVERRRAAGLFALRPGLTGLAQINKIDMRDPQALVNWEMRYMRLRRIILDLRILAQTFLGRGTGDRTSN